MNGFLRYGWFTCLTLLLAACASGDGERGPAGAEGTYCAGNADCNIGLKCVGQVCVPRDDPDVADGDVCQSKCGWISCGDDGCGGSCGVCPDGPCLTLHPVELEFGPSQVGATASRTVELWSCGQSPVTLTGFHLEDGSSAEFAVNLGGWEVEPTSVQPVVLGPQEQLTLKVEYTPLDVSPLYGADYMTSDEGVLVIETNSVVGAGEVTLSGTGVNLTGCPIPVISCGQCPEVLSESVVHLSGSDSEVYSGLIVDYKWSVEQPPEAQGVFSPSATAPHPTFNVTEAGEYTFMLEVTDNQERPSCFVAKKHLVAVPAQGIRVELEWHTPGEPKTKAPWQGKSGDLDLHFLHPWATGHDLDGDGVPDGWFNKPFDCFWLNPYPNWGSYDPGVDDNPHLELDDTDGGGPEILNLPAAEDLVYRVGVHYWGHPRFSPAIATVRVHVNDLLAYTAEDVELNYKDMWSVCTIDMPSGKVLPILDDAGQYKISPQYHVPYFF